MARRTASGAPAGIAERRSLSAAAEHGIAKFQRFFTVLAPGFQAREWQRI
jgi:hypothetical protein